MKKNILFTSLLASFLLVNLNLNSSNNVEEVYKPIRIKNKDYNGASLTIYNCADYIDEALKAAATPEEKVLSDEEKKSAFEEGYRLGLEKANSDIEHLKTELSGFMNAKKEVFEYIAPDILEISVDIAKKL